MSHSVVALLPASGSLLGSYLEVQASFGQVATVLTSQGLPRTRGTCSWLVGATEPELEVPEPATTQQLYIQSTPK